MTTIDQKKHELKVVPGMGLAVAEATGLMDLSHKERTSKRAPAKKAAKPSKPKWAETYDGMPTKCLENTRIMLDHHGAVCRFNLMTHQTELIVDGSDVISEKRNSIGWAAVRELARVYGLDAEQQLKDHIELLLRERFHHPVAEWIKSKPWDGVDRIVDLFMSLNIDPKFEPEESQREDLLRMFKRWLATGARAALVPASAKKGVAAQFVLVLQGPQGKGKTRWIKSLVPNPEWFKEGHHLNPNDKDSVIQATSTWLTELGELDATFKKADLSALKGFLSNDEDVYRRSYGAAAEYYPRRTFFAASVNPRGVLADETGSRRFFFIAVVGCNPDHGIDLQQLWAQAAELPESEMWTTEDEQARNEARNEAFEATNPLADSCQRVWTKCLSEKDIEWHDLDEIKTQIDSRRTWSNQDARILSDVLRNKMDVESKKLHGYRVFAVKRVNGSSAPTAMDPREAPPTPDDHY